MCTHSNCVLIEDNACMIRPWHVTRAYMKNEIIDAIALGQYELLIFIVLFLWYVCVCY